MASEAQIAQIMVLVESGIPLTEIPAGRPPLGEVSHLHHAVGRTHMITTCDIICVIIVCTVVGMRMYTRIHLLKNLWWDDCKFPPATLFDSKADQRHRVYIVRTRMLAGSSAQSCTALPCCSQNCRSCYSTAECFPLPTLQNDGGLLSASRLPTLSELYSHPGSNADRWSPPGTFKEQHESSPTF